MKSPIDKLESELWSACVQRCLAPDDETAERWQEDECLYLRDGFLVRPLPSELRPLVEEAVKQWNEREQKALNFLKMTRDEFLAEYEKARSDLLNGGYDWQLFVLKTERLYASVKNMEWVNLFAWLLPIADLENQERNLAIGRMVTALFSCELMVKLISDKSPAENEGFKRVDARWRFVCRAGTA